MRVAVVGAGFAGLAAADALRHAGADVVVFEARDRVGGRVWSRTLPNGAVVEMGAEFVMPSYTVMLGMVERFDLGLWDKGMRYGDREPRGVAVDRATLLDSLDLIDARLTTLGPDASRVSAESFLGDLQLPPGAREAITARMEVSSANTADAVAASDLAAQTGHLGDACPSIAGGNQRLALALAEGLRVECASPVDRVAWSDGAVRVSVGSGQVDADACVIAVPATVLDRISFEPPLPARTAEAFGSVRYGHAAKLFLPLDGPAPPSAVLSVPERYWTWTAAGADGAVQPVVNCFAGSAPALQALGVGEGPDRWISSLVALRPDLAIRQQDAVLSTWDDDPWARAAYSTITPTPLDTEALTRPVGPLVFCGEHTAGPFAALMEGALRSGLRAADQVRAMALA